MDFVQLRGLRWRWVRGGWWRGRGGWTTFFGEAVHVGVVWVVVVGGGVGWRCVGCEALAARRGVEGRVISVSRVMGVIYQCNGWGWWARA